MEAVDFAVLRRLFDRSVGLTSAEREKFIRDECNGRPDLAIQLQNLLKASDEDASFLERPIDMPSSAIPTKQTEPMASPSQQRIGAYRVVRRLGGGGMGEVFLAIRDDGTFRKHLALKVIRRDLAQDTGALDRFKAERQVLASLEHPNIARILDGGQTEDGSPFYVMEFIEGEPLDEYCNRKKLDVEGRLRLFQQVGRAVHYLHTHQIVHRDLKPSNIFVTVDGIPKLLDFGIAKILGPAGADLSAIYGMPLTPAYASPEQLRNRTITPCSDIYTLGVILFQLLTGNLPHAAKAVAPSTVEPNPSLQIPETATQLKRKVIGDLDRVVLKALEPDPPDRYKTAEDLVDDLGRFLDHRTVIARQSSTTEKLSKFVLRNRVGVAVAALIVVLAIVAATFGFSSLRTQAQLDQLRNNTSRLGGASEAASVQQVLKEIRDLRASLQNPLLQKEDLSNSQVEVRRAILNDATSFLGKQSRLSESSSEVAKEVGETYVQIGKLQQSEGAGKLSDKKAAVATYTSAARQFAIVARSQPGDSSIRQRLADVESRLTRLEARVPPDVEAILRPVEAPPQVTLPPVNPVVPVIERRRIALQKPALPPPPDAPPPAAPAAPPAVVSLQMQTESKVSSAEEIFVQKKNTLAAQGLTLRSTTTESFNKMKMQMKVADGCLSRGDFDGATEAFKVAREYANRLMQDQ